MKKIVLGICLLTMTLSLNGCNNKNTIESINLNKQNNNIDVIQKEIENMTLDEKIGQIITVGIDGYTINDKTKELIVDKKVGGIILFKDNINKFADCIMGGIFEGMFQLQLNILSYEQLVDAKDHPEKYIYLIVRVWGFSAYFNDLPEEYKDNIIRRAKEMQE